MAPFILYNLLQSYQFENFEHEPSALSVSEQGDECIRIVSTYFRLYHPWEHSRPAFCIKGYRKRN